MRYILFVVDVECGGWWICQDGVDAIGPFRTEAEACRAIRKLNKK